LRGIAALGVVYVHYAAAYGFYGLKITGAWGVDVFFVISGFIIAYVVSNNTENFFIKRVFRIFPLYFIATFLTLVPAVFFPDLIHRTEILSMEKFIKSILFIPYEDELKENIPIVGPGWTLNFEMFFYVITAFCVFFVKNKKKSRLEDSVSASCASHVRPATVKKQQNAEYFAKFLRRTHPDCRPSLFSNSLFRSVNCALVCF
jgi:peptidoglycan/LPS O-acetylase OafA/YrhL